jgi:hypothetical protein
MAASTPEIRRRDHGTYLSHRTSTGKHVRFYESLTCSEREIERKPRYRSIGERQSDKGSFEMGLFSQFRVRSRDRDDKTDRVRLRRLEEMVDTFLKDVESERAGLSSRYEEASDEAAFAQAAYEDGRAGADTSRRIDTLTNDIVRCNERLNELDFQIAMIDRIRAEIAGYHAKIDRQRESETAETLPETQSRTGS